MFATQTAPFPTTTADGSGPATGEAIGCTIVSGSMRASVESPKTAHTEPAPTATAPVLEEGRGDRDRVASRG